VQPLGCSHRLQAQACVGCARVRASVRALQASLPPFCFGLHTASLLAPPLAARLLLTTSPPHFPPCSGMCSALQGGLQGLGVHCEEVPRNCLNPDCGGHCCLGCARGGKQDTVNTWLADACQAGARIITGKGGMKGGV
jgi:hypothetical protein